VRYPVNAGLSRRALTIGKLAEATGVNLETVRYYERIGIMPRPARTPGGHRSYEPEHIKWLNFIRRGRELGFTLKEVRELLRLVDARRYTCAQIKKIALRHIADIRQKRADLPRLERMLAEMAAQCHGGQVPECPIIDALFCGVQQPPK
jgi:MerR family mercuric resistance operon transcriptional regulator